VKFRRNQYNQLNVTTNPVVSGGVALFSNSVEPQMMHSMNSGVNEKSPINNTFSERFNNNMGAILQGNRVQTISPRLPVGNGNKGPH
jgi:hypothetical protein